MQIDSQPNCHSQIYSNHFLKPSSLLYCKQEIENSNCYDEAGASPCLQQWMEHSLYAKRQDNKFNNLNFTPSMSNLSRPHKRHSSVITTALSGMNEKYLQYSQMQRQDERNLGPFQNHENDEYSLIPNLKSLFLQSKRSSADDTCLDSEEHSKAALDEQWRMPVFNNVIANNPRPSIGCRLEDQGLLTNNPPCRIPVQRRVSLYDLGRFDSPISKNFNTEIYTRRQQSTSSTSSLCSKESPNFIASSPGFNRTPYLPSSEPEAGCSYSPALTDLFFSMDYFDQDSQHLQPVHEDSILSDHGSRQSLLNNTTESSVQQFFSQATPQRFRQNTLMSTPNVLRPDTFIKSPNMKDENEAATPSVFNNEAEYGRHITHSPGFQVGSDVQSWTQEQTTPFRKPMFNSSNSTCLPSTPEKSTADSLDTKSGSKRSSPPSHLMLIHPNEFKNPSSFLKLYGDPLCGVATTISPECNGNWTCSQCYNVNYPRRQRCNKCDQVRDAKGDAIVNEYVMGVYHEHLATYKRMDNQRRKSISCKKYTFKI